MKEGKQGLEHGHKKDQTKPSNVIYETALLCNCRRIVGLLNQREAFYVASA